VSIFGTTIFRATPDQTTIFTSGGDMKFNVTTLGSFTANLASTQFTYTGSTSVVDFNLNFNVTANDGASYFNFKFFKGLTLLNEVTINDTFGFVNLSTIGVTINNADILKVVISTTSTNFEFFGGGQFNVDLQTPINVPVAYNESISMNACLPVGIFQRDFFVSILKMFNLMVTEDKYKEKHLIIKPYIDFYDQTIIDWSDKMDRQKAIKIKPMSEVNARFYNFKYKQDNDFYNETYFKKFNEGYGDRLYDNNFDFAKDTEVNEIIFASSVLYKTNLNDKVYSVLFKLSNNKFSSLNNAVPMGSASAYCIMASDKAGKSFKAENVSKGPNVPVASS
jgi:hypothetical protein